MNFKINLEDKGQDLLFIITNENGQILETGPFHTALYKGGYVPISQQKIGEPCMIHRPPHIEYGFLKYNVESIEKI
jgi:hypothetical protein